MKKNFIIVLYFFLTTNTLFATTKSLEINIDGQEIKIQAPVGFYEISSLSPETRRIVETLTPPTNRLLAVFVSEEDLGRILKGESPVLNRTVLLQVNRELENIKFTNELFLQLVNLIKKQQNTLLSETKSKVNSVLDNAGKTFSKKFDVQLKIEVGEQVPLGIFNDKPKVLAFASLSKYEIKVEDEKVDLVRVIGSSLILLKGRMFYAYINSDYKTKNDVNWIKSKSKKWADSLLRSNPPFQTTKKK